MQRLKLLLNMFEELLLINCLVFIFAGFKINILIKYLLTIEFIIPYILYQLSIVVESINILLLSKKNDTTTRKDFISKWLNLTGMTLCLLIAFIDYFYKLTFFYSNFFITCIIIGSFIIFASVVIRLISIKTLKKQFTKELQITKNHQLIKDGIYKYIRHPAYSAMIFTGIGASIFYQSILGLLSCIFILIPTIIYKIKIEEKYLSDLFNEEYAIYKSRVKAFIPFII